MVEDNEESYTYSRESTYHIPTYVPTYLPLLTYLSGTRSPG